MNFSISILLKASNFLFSSIYSLQNGHPRHQKIKGGNVTLDRDAVGILQLRLQSLQDGVLHATDLGDALQTLAFWKHRKKGMK